MTPKFDTEFAPDFDQEFPGAYLAWFLEARGVKKVDFAKRCGRPIKTISEIIAGKTAITSETALQFERVLGEDARYWLELESKYQLQQARAKERTKIDHKNARAWAKQFPVSEMIKAGILDKKPGSTDLVETLLKFFGVSSVAAWEQYWEKRLNVAHFKQQDNHAINKFAVAAWLCKGSRLSDQVTTAPYDESAFRDALEKIRVLTTRPWLEIESELIELCRQAGVAIGLVPHLRNTGLRGAAYWAKKDKAVIILSDRGKYEERVWFAFFHEAAHILLHSKKAVFLDQPNAGSAEREVEKEADDFSADTLVPPEQLSQFKAKYGGANAKISRKMIEEFAASIGVASGLLLERLQHEEYIGRATGLNTALKRKLEFRSV